MSSSKIKSKKLRESSVASGDEGSLSGVSGMDVDAQHRESVSGLSDARVVLERVRAKSKRPKLRKNSNESEREAEGGPEREKEKDDIRIRMNKLSVTLRAFLMNEANKISKAASEFILGGMSEYEGLLNELMCRNERLKGRLEEIKGAPGRVSGVSSSRPSIDNVGMSVPGAHGVRIEVSYAVIVKGIGQNEDATSEQIKERVMKHIKPEVNIRVKAVRKIRSGGIAIETVSEKERRTLRDCCIFEKVGLKVDLPRTIGPKIIAYDVPHGVKNEDMLSELHERNLKGVITEKVMREQVRIVSRNGKKGADVGNVIIELPGSARNKIINAGRLYVG